MVTTGKLPDGMSFSASGALVIGPGGSQFVINDQSLAYPSVSTRGTKGSLAGTLTFESLSGSGLDGSLTWTKPAQTKGDYPGAIDTTLNVIGSLYTPPPRGGSVLPGFTAGTLAVTDMSGSIFSAPAALTSANKISLTNPPGKLKMTITPSTGVFKGSFVYPGQTKATDFSGVLFQDQTIGGGFFLGPNGSGTVQLEQ